MKNSLWETVSKAKPCPICGKPDWCLLATSGEVAICYRKQSPYLARSGSGWIHRLKENRVESVSCRKDVSPNLPPAPKLDFARLHRSYDGDDVLLDGLALELGVEASALKALDVRFNHMDSCWSFPMRDASGTVVGLRYRELGGSRKWSARGSRDGLFFDPFVLRSSFATQASSQRALCIAEGASDTAAALSLGLTAIGRSSCTSGIRLIKEFVRHVSLRASHLSLPIVIIADNDTPGLAGARALASALGTARIITPPQGRKDLREWYKIDWPSLSSRFFPLPRNFGRDRSSQEHRIRVPSTTNGMI